MVRDAFLDQRDLQGFADILPRQRAVPRSSTSNSSTAARGSPGTRNEAVPAAAPPSCSPWLMLVQQSPPCDSTLSVTCVLQQLLRTILAHHDQHAAQLSAGSTRAQVHVEMRIAATSQVAPSSRSFRPLSVAPHQATNWILNYLLLVCPVTLCPRQLRHRFPRFGLPQPALSLLGRCHRLLLLRLHTAQCSLGLFRLSVLFQERSLHSTNSLQQNNHVFSRRHEHPCESKELRYHVCFPGPQEGCSACDNI